MRVLLLAALLLAPVAAARAPDEAGYREQARDLVRDLDASVVRAREATVEHAFGGLDARGTARVMRAEEAHLRALSGQLDGMPPARSLARTHETLAQAVAWYAEGMGLLERCFRSADEPACDAATVRVSWAATYRDVAADALGVRGFS